MTNSIDRRASLVAQARELIAKVRANGHDIVVVNGAISFPLHVSAPTAEPCAPRGKGLPSYAIGVDLTPYEAILGDPDRGAIFAEALGEA